MKKIIFSMMLFVLASGFILCGGFQEVMAAEKDKYGGTLKLVASLRTPRNFGDPLNCIMVNFGHGNTYYESLVTEGPPGEGMQPELAESWKLSPDKKSYTFNLRKGVKFHDGTEFNAQAVKMNLDRIIKANLAVSRPAKGKGKKGPPGKKGKGGKKGGPPMGGFALRNVSSVDILDDYTVRVNMSKFDAVLLNDMATGYGFIASPAALEKDGGKWIKSNPVGTGAFKFVSYKQDIRIINKKFEGYRRKGLPYLDGFQFDFVKDPTSALASLQKGDTHVMARAGAKDAKAMKAKGFNVVSAIGVLRTMAPDTTNAKSVFTNKKVREAVEYAIDRKTIAKTLGHGIYKPAYQVAPESSYTYNPTLKPREFNPEKAKQLLAEAGYPDGFKAKIVTSGRPPETKFLFTSIQGYLSKVGIVIDLDLVDPGKERTLRFEGGLETNSLLSMHLGYRSEYVLTLNEVLAPGAKLVPQLARPAALGGQLMASINSMTAEEKARNAQEAVRILYEDVTVIPIWQNYVSWIMAPEVQDHPFGKIDHSHYWFDETWLKK